MLVLGTLPFEREHIPDYLDVLIQIRSTLNGIGRNEDELFADRTAGSGDLPT
jgi:hypothetical protein